MKMNIPKMHAIITAIAVVCVALTFLLQLLNVSFMAMSPSPMLIAASAVIMMLAVTATTMSFLISVYRIANK